MCFWWGAVGRLPVEIKEKTKARELSSKNAGEPYEELPRANLSPPYEFQNATPLSGSSGAEIPFVEMAYGQTN